MKSVRKKITKYNEGNFNFVLYIQIVEQPTTGVSVGDFVGDAVGDVVGDVVGDAVAGKLSTASTNSLQYAKSSI